KATPRAISAAIFFLWFPVFVGATSPAWPPSPWPAVSGACGVAGGAAWMIVMSVGPWFRGGGLGLRHRARRPGGRSLAEPRQGGDRADVRRVDGECLPVPG